MADAREVRRAVHVKVLEHPDRVVASLAERQHGVVSRRQLLELGVTREAIAQRLRMGRLYCLYRGVYAVGHRLLDPKSRWMAATLAAGPNAALSHRAAAALWGITAAPDGPVDLTVPSSRPARAGIRWHTSHLPPDEVTSLNAIPTTSVPRTLLDLATTLSPSRLENAINESERRRLTDALSLEDLLARYPRRLGTPALRKILDVHKLGDGVTREELEARFLEFLRARGFPRPELNAPIQLRDRLVVADCLWRQQRLIVELDSWGTHGTRAAFERDRARRRKLDAAGLRVIEVTWRQLQDEADELAADLEASLQRRAA